MCFLASLKEFIPSSSKLHCLWSMEIVLLSFSVPCKHVFMSSRYKMVEIYSCMLQGNIIFLFKSWRVLLSDAQEPAERLPTLTLLMWKSFCDGLSFITECPFSLILLHGMEWLMNFRLVYFWNKTCCSYSQKLLFPELPSTPCMRCLSPSPLTPGFSLFSAKALKIKSLGK